MMEASSKRSKVGHCSITFVSETQITMMDWRGDLACLTSNQNSIYIYIYSVFGVHQTEHLNGVHQTEHTNGL